MEKITSALRRLNLSEHQQLVYLSLLREGRATARTLSARTSITRPSVYDQLKSLIALGLVVELDIEGKAEFAAADLKYLDALLGDRIDRLEQSRAFLQEALPSLIDSLETVTPKVRFFEGQEGVKQLMKDIMWHDHITLKVIWPYIEMRTVFDDAFLHWFDQRRAIRKLHTSVLCPHSTKKEDISIFASPTDKIQKLPKGTHPTMASIVYDSKTAFISSSHEAFGFIVESNEHAQLQTLHFDALWDRSVKFL